MLELIRDYAIENKYILSLIGFLMITSLWQCWKMRRLNKRIKITERKVLSLHTWSHELYNYLEDGK